MLLLKRNVIRKQRDITRIFRWVCVSNRAFISSHHDSLQFIWDRARKVRISADHQDDYHSVHLFTAVLNGAFARMYLAINHQRTQLVWRTPWFKFWNVWLPRHSICRDTRHRIHLQSSFLFLFHGVPHSVIRYQVRVHDLLEQVQSRRTRCCQAVIPTVWVRMPIVHSLVSLRFNSNIVFACRYQWCTSQPSCEQTRRNLIHLCVAWNFLDIPEDSYQIQYACTAWNEAEALSRVWNSCWRTDTPDDIHNAVNSHLSREAV